VFLLISEVFNVMYFRATKWNLWAR